MAALLPNGWDCEICIETIEDIPFDTDADIVGIGGMGHAAVRSIEIAQEFRKRGKPVIMGGPMASLAPKILMDYFDSVIIGDAPDILQQVLKDFEQNNLKPSL